MRRSLAFALLGAALAASGLQGGDSRAETDAADRRAHVVARIGDGPGSRAVTVGEIEDRLAAIPPFQRATFGSGPAGIRRGFLDQVVIREELLALGGAALASQPGTAFALERVRSQATIRAVRDRVGPASGISLADVEQYYAANRDRYETPERYQIWRILCKTRDEADAVLADAKRDATPKKFAELARDHSADKATYLRSGNLGFVTPDGASNEPGWTVDAAVVRAVQSVRDGEFVPTPVAEGEFFSVVWRRGTIAAMKRSVGDAAAQIRDTMWKARVKEETDELLASLRASKVRDLKSDGLASIHLPPEAEASKLRTPDGG